jgi:hypothetical protein
MSLKYKKNPSYYESSNIIWKNIHFDKELLLKFIKRLNFVRFLSSFSKRYKDEYNNLLSILESKDQERIQGLLNNDEDICRASLIEKWSRIGAVELIIFGRYTKDTYTLISNLPIEDYILIEKRIRELINLVNDIRIEENNISNTTPGL